MCWISMDEITSDFANLAFPGGVVSYKLRAVTGLPLLIDSNGYYVRGAPQGSSLPEAP